MTTATLLAQLARKQAVLRLPDMDKVQCRSNLPYRHDDAGAVLDIYYPNQQGSGPWPVVMLVTGYPMSADHKSKWGPFTSWARLLAVSGMAAVIYACKEPVADAQAVLAFLHGQAGALQLQAERIGLWSSSGSCPTALALLQYPTVDAIRCAAFCYGYMMDVPGRTDMADAARLYGFANPGNLKTTADISVTIPLLVLRAGQDNFAGVNTSIDNFIAAALACNLHLSLLNHNTGLHAFDVDEDSATSRALIQQVLNFLASHLNCKLET